MFKPVGTIVIFSILLCTACDDYTDYMSSYTLSSERLLLLSAAERQDCKQDASSVESAYEPFFQELKTIRKDTVRSNDNHTFYIKPGSPFCDAIYELKATELKFSDRKCTISYAHETLVNEDITATCSRWAANDRGDRLSIVPKEEKVDKEPITKETSTPEKIVISNAMYDDLINAVKTCKRAEYATISEFSPEQEITKEAYDKVRKIIIDCKRYQLEHALQEHSNDNSNN